MKNTWKKLAVMVVTASMVICGGAMSVSAAAETPEKVTVNVAYMPDYSSLNGLISAVELGYFEDENIDVELTEFADGPTVIQAMESGSIDIGYIGQGALYKGFDYRADHSHDDEVCGWIADKIKLDKQTLLDQVNVADWTTSEFVRNNMDDIKGYYELQQKTFIESGDCEETPVDDYVLFDVMEEACAE